MEPEDLGPYGWRVHFSFGEHVHAYLDTETRLLFYYVSW